MEKKKKMVNLRSSAAPSPGHDLTLKCAWCGEVRGVEGSWRTPSRWDPRESGFTHGICPRCFTRESAALRKLKKH